MVNRGNTQDLSSLQVFGMMKCNRAHVFDVFSVVISSLSSSLQLFVYFSFCCALLCRSSSRSGSRCEIHIQPVGLACKPSSWASKKFSLYHSFFSQTLTILRLFSNLLVLPRQYLTMAQTALTTTTTTTTRRKICKTRKFEL